MRLTHGAFGAHQTCIAHAARQLAPVQRAVRARASCPLSDSPYGSDVSVAYEAVALASHACTRIQRTLLDSSIVTKPDDSPVTVADYAAQAIVSWVLQKHGSAERLRLVAEEDSDDLRAPEGARMLTKITELVDSIVSEAHPGTRVTEADLLALIDLGNCEGGAQGRHYVLDPIDGTRGFVASRQYALCLGLVQEGEVIVGVLGCPNVPHAPMTYADAGPSKEAGTERAGVGTVFAAAKGVGSYQGPLLAGVPSERVHVKDPVTSEALAMESFEARHSNHSLSASVLDTLGVTREPLRADSQVKYGLLARGDGSLFLRFAPEGYREKIWDHCAGVIVTEEAGGRVTDASGRPLDFSRGRWLDLEGGGIVAAPPALHAKVIAALEARRLAAAA